MFGMFQKTGLVITASRVAVFSTPPAPLPRGCFPAQPAPSSFTRHRVWPPGVARCPSSVAAWSPLSSSRPSVAARVRLPRVCRSLADSCPEIIFASGHLRGARQ